MKRLSTTPLSMRFASIVICSMLVMLCVQSANAQNDSPFNLRFEVRADYQQELLSGAKDDANSGFRGKYLNILLDGKISPKFSYSYRQRLNKTIKDKTFFDATDWIVLNYQPTKNWGISAGKQVVLIGGWEYDGAPIDLYFCSEFWNNISCYQFGASVTYTTNKGNDHLTVQACQSPFDTPSTDLYAYNLFWNGKHGCYHALHSFNVSEYERGKFVYYVVLGNRFTWGDAMLQVDLMNRGGNARELLFKDFSVMSQFSYMVAQRVNIFARATYDKCEMLSAQSDMTIFPGSDLTRVGGGVEYYPLGGKGDRSIRLHAVYGYTFGRNGNPAGALINDHTYFSIGLTWKVNVIETAKKLFTKKDKAN